MPIRRSAVAVASVTVLLFSQAGAQSRDFANPTHEGMAISYCGSDSSSCGEPMATAWCQINGYDLATNWAARAGIDSSHRTIQLDSGVVCQGAACEAFGSITCRSDTQGFTMPTMGPNERSTVLTPNRRGTQASLDDSEYTVLIPGCSQVESGVFRC